MRPTSRVASTTLCNFHVPENRRIKLEDVADVLSECGRLKPFPPRHIRHFAESHLDRMAGPIILRLPDGPMQVCHLVHDVEQRSTRLLVIERRVQPVRPGPALLSKRINEK